VRSSGCSPLVLLAGLLFSWPLHVNAATGSIGEQQSPPVATRPELRPRPTTRPPTIDGVLDEDVWRGRPLDTGDWLTYNPLHGDAIKQQTKVWMAYDSSFIYLAFQCDDPEPSRINHYDRGFEMETAFINRVGITSGWGYAEVNFYPDQDKYPWVHRISPFSFTQGGRDRNAGGNELLQLLGVRLNFTRQGFIRLDYFDGFEIWAGEQFDRGNWRAQGNVQLYRWLFLEGSHMFGLAVYYDRTPLRATALRPCRLRVAHVRRQPGVAPCSGESGHSKRFVSFS
jgi:hypothetical protein